MKRGKLIKLKKPKLADFYRSFTSRPAVYWLSVVALFVVISRWLGHMRFLYSGDSVNYALALDNYDITLHQPHPPGYALYILLAKPIHWLTGDANVALVIISIILSVALVYAVFYFAKTVYEERVAWMSVFLLMSSPMVWFHGQIALNYLSDALFATLFGLFAYRALAESKSTRYLTWASVILAVGGGFRPTLLIFLALLWLWVVLRRGSFKILVGQAGVVGGLTLLWLVPVVYLSGGPVNVWHAVYSLIFDKSALYSFSVAQHGWAALVRYSTLLFHNLTLSLGWGVASVALFVIYLASPRTEAVKIDYRRLIFWVLWLLPPLLFYLLVVFTIPGYLLVVLPAVVVLVAKATEEVIRGVTLAVTRKPRIRSHFILGATIIVTMMMTGVNVYHYYRPDKPFTPEKPTYFAIKLLDHLWDNLIPTIRREFNPQNTVIGINEAFLTWGLGNFKYYLPEYIVYQGIYWGVYNPDKMIWYRAYHRRTEMVKTLELTSLDSKFIVIRDEWSGEVSKLYSKVPLIPGDKNDIDELLYYDLTDPAVREAVTGIGSIGLPGVTLEEKNSSTN